MPRLRRSIVHTYSSSIVNVTKVIGRIALALFPTAATRATPHFSGIRKLTTSKAGAAHRTRHLTIPARKSLISL
jgi:hypothetical protein